MKPRFLDAMGEALNLVRNSNLAEATALLRKALSGEEARGPRSDPEARRSFHRVPALAPAARRPLGEVLRALRARRPLLPDARPRPPTRGPRMTLAKDSPRALIAARPAR